MWFVRDEEGKTHCVEDVEKAAEDFARSVKHCYEIQKSINENLRKENQKLKDEHYKALFVRFHISVSTSVILHLYRNLSFRWLGFVI